MATYDYDLVILGGGSAGLTAAKVGRFFAKKVALVDKDKLGGDCLYYGCVPSKALIKAARVMHEVKTSARWGLQLHGLDVTLGAVNGRVQSAIQDVARIDSKENLNKMGVDVFLAGDEGASFLDDHTIAAGPDRLTAKYVLIVTGSRAAKADVPGLAEAGYLTNEDVFDLQNLPRRLGVIGGGPIGVELAQAFRRLGSDVTVLQRAPHLIPRDDADLIAILERTFADEGIAVHYDTQPAAVRVENGEKLIDLVGAHGRAPHNGGSPPHGGSPPDGPAPSHGGAPLRVDEILVAVGRTPNVEQLKLENAGVTYSPRGIPVNDKLQTNVSHIYAAGDVVGGLQFTHYAGYQAAQAVRNIFLPLKLKFDPGLVPWVTFTDPEIGHVGLTEAEAKRNVKECHVVTFPYAELERAVTDQDPVGLMKFIIDGKRRIIGCHIAGNAAGEMINEITLAMNNDLTVDKVIGSIHAYPTYSFGIPVALYDFVLNDEPAAIAKVGRFLSRLT
jgi:pyruvate/2-oxoglutarate dehydrogenase complex dihydrolipoamide dehydrogenase (E3) component